MQRDRNLDGYTGLPCPDGLRRKARLLRPPDPGVGWDGPLDFSPYAGARRSGARRSGAPALGALQTFGLSDSSIAAHEQAVGARPRKLLKIEARIVGLALTGDGRTLFTLDNTQVWQQIDSDGDSLAKLGDSATISRGLLGSYWLQLKSRRGCKVGRVR